LAFALDGKTLALGGRADGVVLLWDVATGKPRELLTGHQRTVTALAYSPDGRWLASGSADRTILRWDVAGKDEP